MPPSFGWQHKFRRVLLILILFSCRRYAEALLGMSRLASAAISAAAAGAAAAATISSSSLLGSTASDNAAAAAAVAGATSPAACRTLPKLVALDLDGTIWFPDMYMLAGSPFRAEGDGTKLLYDRNGREVRLLGISSQILETLKTSPEWEGVKTAWVSRTDEPEWANECLQKFKTPSGNSIGSFIDSSQIYPSDKKKHFQALKREFPEIEFREMIFFDNEFDNIRSVSQLGVHSVYCPDGMTAEVWQQGLKTFAEAATAASASSSSVAASRK